MKNKKNDPFDFDDPVVVKKEFTREEVKAFEKDKLTPFLCKEGDDDYVSHMEYLRSLLDEAMKAKITKREAKFFSSPSTKREILNLVKNMPEMAKIKPLKLDKGADDEEVQKAKKKQEKRIQDAREAFKTAIREWRSKDAEKELKRIAKNSIVGHLMRRGRDRFLRKEGVIGFYKDGTMFIVKDKITEYQKLQNLLSAYDDLVGKREYAKQQELIEMSQGIADDMKV